MNKLSIVFPSSYYSRNKVEEDLQAEYDAVTETGVFDVCCFQ